MRKHQRLTWAAIVAASVVASAAAQQPPTSGAKPPVRPKATSATSLHPKQRSIVHHYPYPYPNYYTDDSHAGWRNPGGAGRYLEYYPPGDRFQEAGDPVRVARFDQGGGAPDRAEQLQAQQIGIQRYNSIQNHIDRMARPYIGYGVGYFGGFY